MEAYRKEGEPDYSPLYRALCKANYDAYRKAIDYAGAYALATKMNLRNSAMLEANFVAFACDLLEVEC